MIKTRQHNPNRRGVHRTAYTAWMHMRQRCLKSDHPQWAYYGGRGITICERWLGYDNFIEDMGPCPIGLSLERIDNDKGYSPKNCKWATRKEQAINRCSTRFITFNGQTHTMSDWARITGLGAALGNRIYRSWPIEEALTKPKFKYVKRK